MVRSHIRIVWATGGLAALLAALLLVGPATTAYSAPPTLTAYRAPLDLGTLGGSSAQAHGINDAGQVVGLSTTSGNAETHPFIWDAAGMTDIGTLGGRYAQAFAINNVGQVVGNSLVNPSDPYNPVHAFVWDAVHGMTDLTPSLTGANSQAVAADINDSGYVVGQLFDASAGLDQAHVWNPDGTGHTLRTNQIGGYLDSALAINNSGYVVGTYVTSVTQQFRAVIWDPAGNPTDIGTLGGTSARPFDINDLGQVVGLSTTATDPERHPFLWDPDIGMRDLAGAPGIGISINESSMVAGSTQHGSHDHGLAWTPASGPIDLNALSRIVPRYVGGVAINESGQIAGQMGEDAHARAVLWEPSTSPTLSVGDATVVEGDVGKPRALQFPVTLSEPVGSAVTADYSIEVDGSSADGSDFQVATGTVTFARSSKTGLTSTTSKITAKVTPDQALEGDATFRVVLSNPTAGIELGRSVGVGRIVDDDPPATRSVGVGDVSLAEGNAGAATKARVTLSLSSPATSALSVLVTVTPGSALAGSDFKAAKPRTLTFKPGQFQKSLAFSIYPDTEAESGESFTITISDPSAGLTIARPVGTVTILDDD